MLLSKFQGNWPSGSEEDMLTEAYNPISSPVASGSGELKILTSTSANKYVFSYTELLEILSIFI